jgi:hypothetical protein
VNQTHLPPLPPAGVTGPEVCEIVRLYLAVWDDLTPEQKQAVAVHLEACANCLSMQRLMNLSTRLVGGLDASSPSSRVDSAVNAAIAARQNGQAAPPRRPFLRYSRSSRATPLRLTGLVAVAAVILFAVLTTLHFVGIPTSRQTAFILPATLTWSGYVLYHTETRTNSKGHPYQVDTYHDLATDSMHIEMVEDSTVHIAVVSDNHHMLAMDMMHHIAQWGSTEQSVDESMFELPLLRRDLQTHQAVYLGKDHFQGQDVYLVRCDNGLVLLLDMHYRPVNVLRSATGPGTGVPVYDTLRLLSHSEVPNSMWDMHVPPGFQMGTVPQNM